jgi:hypothetical protein
MTILLLVPWHGRVHAGHLGNVRKKSFIVGKWNTDYLLYRERERLCTGRKNKRECVYFRLVSFHFKLGGWERLCTITWF